MEIRFFQRSLFLTSCMLMLTLAACVTVNIYFPAAEVEKAAEQIVEDVYGAPASDTEEKPEGSSCLNIMLALFAPAEAHAADARTVSNAAIRGLKNKIAQNHKQLAKFYKNGNIGISKQGLVAIRNTNGLPMPEVAKMKGLVNADNKARQQLYSEVAKALKVDGSQVGKVQAIFAGEWRSKAPGGYWIQENNGSWRKK